MDNNDSEPREEVVLINKSVYNRLVTLSRELQPINEELRKRIQFLEILLQGVDK